MLGIANTINNRRIIQQAHERAVIKDFLNWLNAKHCTKYVVIKEPNPPEAVIRSLRRTRWVEVGDVFWTGEYARDLYSYATPGETHRPVGPGPFVDMDISFARSFTKVLGHKLTKKSYGPCYEKYGHGFLILCMHHPWFDKQTIAMMKEYNSTIDKNKYTGFFGEVFISFSSLNKRAFMKWK